MIQELRLKNFLSFKDETTFSFEATKDTTAEKHQVVQVVPGVRLLRFAIIFGANASGKSNILRAFDFLKRFWFEDRLSSQQATDVVPFLLDNESGNEPTSFDLKFWVDGVKYWYTLSLTRERVEKECLYYYKTIQPTKLFDRKFENGQSVIRFNAGACRVNSRALQELSLKCLPNVSFFVARSKVNLSLPIIDVAVEWMRTRMLPSVGPKTDLLSTASERIGNDSVLKDHLLDFINRADFNISEIPTRQRDTFSAKAAGAWFMHRVHTDAGIEEFPLSLALQSEGTLRTLGVETYIYDAAKANAFLAIDEIETSLHPDLVEYIIAQFLNRKDECQLLVTSHYDMLLNTIDDLLRRDSVWFTEKDGSGQSTLYSLVEFNGLGKLSSPQRSYRNGKFGALPNIM